MNVYIYVYIFLWAYVKCLSVSYSIPSSIDIQSCIALGRIIRPADVAASVGFLLSDSAAMLTGSFIELHPEYAEGMQGLAADEAQRI